jgi:transcriptional regulator GlxA family with amidase domain
MFAKFFIDYETVVPMIGEDVDVRPLTEPRLMFFDERVLMLVRLLAMECSDSTQTDLLYADSLSVALLLRLCRLGKSEEASPRKALAPQRLRLAQDYMRSDLSTNVRLEDVASLLGLSPAHFSRAFKQCTGLSPHQWRLSERLEQARRLLVESPHTIAQVAVSTGFSDQAHFTRVFRRIYGVTPAVWKREAR